MSPFVLTIVSPCRSGSEGRDRLTRLTRWRRDAAGVPESQRVRGPGSADAQWFVASHAWVRGRSGSEGRDRLTPDAMQGAGWVWRNVAAGQRAGIG